jgi:hypothetical protein
VTDTDGKPAKILIELWHREAPVDSNDTDKRAYQCILDALDIGLPEIVADAITGSLFDIKPEEVAVVIKPMVNPNPQDPDYRLIVLLGDKPEDTGSLGESDDPLHSEVIDLIDAMLVWFCLTSALTTKIEYQYTEHPSA